jgi:hypothetical protein
LKRWLTQPSFLGSRGVLQRFEAVQNQQDSTMCYELRESLAFSQGVPSRGLGSPNQASEASMNSSADEVSPLAPCL